MFIVCTNCQSRIRVPDHSTAKQGKCAKCGTILDLPAAAPPVPDQPTAAVAELPLPAITAEPARAPTQATPDAAHDPQGETVASAAADEPAVSPADYAFLAPPQLPDELGRLGPYRVLKVLGRGGMGVVFLAEDVRLGRQVALKAMLPEMASKPTARDRFLREARTAAAIEHDYIVAIFQVGEDRGVPFIAMPLLKGCSLEDWLRTQHDQPLPVLLVLKLGKQVAEGLAAAHAHGLIHRDIKPANIFLQSTARGSAPGGMEQSLSAALSLTADAGPHSADFRVKVLDFGLARSSAGEQNLTLSGVIMGTPAYMAPEQARSGSKVDARADLFSLGVVLYRLCTGKLPFKGDDLMSTLMALAMDTPTAPAALNLELPLTLSDLVMQLLAKDPKDRVGSAEQVVKALEAIEASFIAATAHAPAGKATAHGAYEVPVVYQAPGRSGPHSAPPTVGRATPPPRPRDQDDEDKVEAEPEARPRRRRQADRDEDEDDDLRDLRALKKEDTMLSTIAMIVGIVSAVFGVLSLCCCGIGPFMSPIAGIGGGTAIVLGVMGHKRGGRNFAVAGISLGIVGVCLALATVAFFVFGLSMNLLGPAGPFGRR